MRSVLKQLLDAELRSAVAKNYKLELWLAFILASIFTLMSFTTNNFSWAGMLLAVLYFWHRYVVLNVARDSRFSDTGLASAEPSKTARDVSAGS